MYTDIVLDEITQDIVVSSGDFRIGDGTNQLQNYLIVSAPGHFKEFPLLGGNIFQYLNSTTSPAEIERNLKTCLAADIFASSFVDTSGFPTIIVNNLQVKLTT